MVKPWIKATVFFDHKSGKTSVFFDHDESERCCMKRIIDSYLSDWKDNPYRKPLLLRGARQVGKTYAVQNLGKSFESFVEINFESDPQFKEIFDQDLNPSRIIQEITLISGKKIEAGKTLLFFDEIQAAPKALTALRYFYEKLPQQHIIAAGSLIDFTIQMIGIPVGRVSSLYMYPLSFLEFLCALGYSSLVHMILSHSAQEPISETVHQKIITVLGEYFAIGGMPEAVLRWQETRDARLCFEVHHALIDTYRQDFEKYASRFQIKYLEALFKAIPRQMGTKFKYSSIEGDYRKRELAPSLDLLITAGIAHSVLRSAGNGIPLGAEVDPSDFKVLFLDVALAQTILGFDIRAWFLQPQKEFVNKGAFVEAFVGHELLAYSHPTQKAGLYYWRRNTKGSEAEVDYVIQKDNQVVPVEVKGGAGSTLKSMHLFLENHTESPYGLRFSTQNYSVHEKIKSYPLYAVSYVAFKEHLGQQVDYAFLCE